MIEVETYFDEESNDIKAHLSKDNWSKEYYLDSEQACELIKYFSASKLLDVRDDGKDALFLFENYQFKINDYKSVFKNSKLKELFLPLFFKTRKLLKEKNVKKLNKKKTIRKNKYLGPEIFALGLATYIFFTASAKADGIVLEQPNVQDPTIDYNDNQIENSYSKAVESLKEKGLNVEIDIPSHDVKFSPPPKHTEETSLIEPQNNNKIISDNTNNDFFFIDYEDRTSTDKAVETRENYSSVIEKYARMYGLDPKLILAIATQETGNHYKYLDSGPAIGLMQIEKSVWKNGGKITAYNFETSSWETITLTADDYDNFMYNLRDLDYNVKIACMLFQYNLRYFDYNILAGIQAYNMGMGSLDRVIDNYCMDKNLIREQVLDNQYDDGWLLYRNYISSGDSLYIEHVLSYCEEDETISVKKPDGTVISIIIGRGNSKTLH